MAKKNFNFGDSPVAKTAESIREEKHTASTTHAPIVPQNIQPQPEPNATAKVAIPSADEDKPQAKKTEVGVTIQMPKKYYRMLRDIKDETGTPLRDLALKAVIDFVDAYQFED